MSDNAVVTDTLGAALEAQERAASGENLDIRNRIAAAEAAGDWDRAGSLKTELLLRQATPGLAQELYPERARTAPAEGSPAAEIARLEAAGDWEAAGALKTQALLDRMRQDQEDARVALGLDATKAEARRERIAELEAFRYDDEPQLSKRERAELDRLKSEQVEEAMRIDTWVNLPPDLRRAPSSGHAEEGSPPEPA